MRDDEQERAFPRRGITDDECRYSKPASPLRQAQGKPSRALGTVRDDEQRERSHDGGPRIGVRGDEQERRVPRRGAPHRPFGSLRHRVG